MSANRIATQAASGLSQARRTLEGSTEVMPWIPSSRPTLTEGPSLGAQGEVNVSCHAPDRKLRGFLPTFSRDREKGVSMLGQEGLEFSGSQRHPTDRSGEGMLQGAEWNAGGFPRRKS